MISIETSQLHLVSKDGWQKWKLAHAFQLIGSGTTPPTSNVEYFQGVIPWVNTGDLNDKYIKSVNKCVSVKAVNDFPTLKIYPKGSIIIALYGATIGKLGILQIDACTNQACCILAQSIYLDTKFVFYWLMSERSNIIKLAHGGGQPNISQEIVKNLRILAPAIDKQKAIASFLDRKTAAIDTLIAKKQRLIQLLEEKRTALINQAVTKGLNLNVPMKDSGIPWIGEIPEHWDIKRIGYISQVVRGASPRPAGDQKYFDGDAHPWITVGEITKDQKMYLTETETFLTELGCQQSRLIPKGTLLLSNSGATLGVPKIIAISGCINDGSVALFDISKQVDKEFIYFVFTSMTNLLRDRLYQGSGQPNLNTDLVKAIRFSCPPLEEQIKIVSRLKAQIHKNYLILAKQFDQIEKLQEYRQSLITAAVTGKIDIREEVAA